MKGSLSFPAQSVLLENSQANPRLEQILNGNTGPVVSAIFSPDGNTLASGTYDKDILLWDVKTRQPTGKLSGHSNIVRSIAFNPGWEYDGFRQSRHDHHPVGYEDPPTDR